MADIDEDAVPPSGQPGVEVDLSEEAQDFRFLANLLNAGSQHKLPKRGEKDFEPDATQMQTSVLEASRAAMEDALSYTRVHRGKNRTKAILDYGGCGAFVEKPHDRHFMTMGRWTGGQIWLAPEEALYLLERGSLDVQWPPDLLPGDEGAHGAGEEDTVPMSLQAAYSVFIGMGQSLERPLTMEMYSVYAHLKRLGYIVIRAGIAQVEGPTTSPPARTTSLFSFLAERRSRSAAASLEKRGIAGPLVSPGLYRSYGASSPIHRLTISNKMLDDIFHLLRIIPSHNPTTKPTDTPTPPYFDPDQTPDPDALSITFHVYKPSSNYSKRSPPPPDYQIAVMSARETTVPSLAQLSSLLASTPYAPPPESMPLYQRLKKGHRNVILAIVDCGIVSYLTASDAGFAIEGIQWSPRKRGPPFKRSGGRKGRHRAAKPTGNGPR
ncbi:hypothetical protein P152DRAFT_447736 [Eremomyces bilateralis CBS 781.70]|uniref:tRNA-splicing endonuclease subunit Sen54 N-terminal domain-containing protein n=1 Tax=Eremomyces bilateralis CBS 781.70 TaxID=1392243 RepID=A0A6G1G8J8_9PEZI|nr:uncharacterized protein P152DRAFT_447736 [Eremomyces bilateralis CBS 781.70]KAF1814364.1 hypothetical protein P152DRAFT_447736 [Eremomyces bilateralis CBS 781.70]